MPPYADTSVVVSLLVQDGLSPAARQAMAGHARIYLSDFLRVEFAAATARRVRMRLLTPAEAAQAFAALDTWVALATPCALLREDMQQVEAWLRRLDINLRGPDALHLAMAHRLGAPLLTLDRGMADAARALGVPLPA